jgi:hypothetical protein
MSSELEESKMNVEARMSNDKEKSDAVGCAVLDAQVLRAAKNPLRTSDTTAAFASFRHLGFVIPSSFVIRHSDFVISSMSKSMSTSKRMLPTQT